MVGATKYKGILVLMTVMILVLCLTGCKDKGKDKESSDGGGVTGAPQDGQQITLPDVGVSDTDGGLAPDELDFGLQSPGDPDFSDYNTSQNEGLYTIENGVAYALDPDTLEKTGPALDPITHEPIDSTDTGDDSVIDPNPQPEQNDTSIVISDPEDTAVVSDPEDSIDTKNESEPSVSEPEPEIKLPNTGVFLEDD